MAATTRFIHHAVGPGQPNHPEDVRHIQQMLIASRRLPEDGENGVFGARTASALAKYLYGMMPQVSHLAPDAPHLVSLANEGHMLISLPGHPRLPGVETLHNWFVGNNIRYNEGAQDGRGDRAIYGVHGNPRYAVQRTHYRFARGPVKMDCTTYVNIMLSIYARGDAHDKPYDASCPFGMGSANHLARERYGLPLVLRGQHHFFRTAAEIRHAAGDSHSGLYVIEVGGKNVTDESGRVLPGAVSHMALLVGNPQFWVYECTTHQKSSACRRVALDPFVASKHGAPLYLFGPARA